MCVFSYLDCLSKYICFAASPLSFQKNNSSKKESDLASPIRWLRPTREARKNAPKL